MKTSSTLLAIAYSLVLTTSMFAEETLLVDPFTAEPVPARRAMRGDWKIAEGTARCTQDDELYKKYKDHGPILFYDLPYQDAVVRFQYRPHGARSVVFTMNSQEGHVLRVITTERGTDVRAFPPGEGVKSISLQRVADLPLVDDEWTSVEVSLRGDRALVKINDKQVADVSHATFRTAKTNLSVGFSFGTVDVRELSVTR